MRVVMIGTPTCTKCKSIRPVIEDHCKKNNIEFHYTDTQSASRATLELLVSKQIKSAPAFLLYREDESEPLVLTGDDVFLELNV